jgi:GntR family transcriptional regulator / MocR family aminotransferase
MSIEWTGLGPEVLLTLDRARPEPLRAQLERELREAIRAGRLHEGERLPSSRTLARELGVSRGLVLECYSQLQAEGYLMAEPGSGTRVAARSQPPASRTVSEATPQAPAIDFRPGVPDLTSFPRSDWAWALRDACRTAPTASLGYTDVRGSPRLREIIAAYLRRVRGAASDAENIVITMGFAQALTLVLGALARRGVERVAFEDPGYSDFRETGAWVGVEPVPVRVDDMGIDVATLAESSARAVVLTPAHQTPTGVALAPERRHALVAWAEACDATIVEDDYDAEFRYDREPIGAMQGLAPERVALAGTVSKALAPALRIGWLVCPPDLVDAVVDAKLLSDRGSPGLDQLALAAMMESGRYDRHLRRMRAVYASKSDTLVRALKRHAPSVELHGLAAGFHAVARLPAGMSEGEVVEAARERSVGLHGLSRFRADGSTEPPELLLGFGNLTESAIEHGIAAIGDLLEGGELLPRA